MSSGDTEVKVPVLLVKELDSWHKEELFKPEKLSRLSENRKEDESFIRLSEWSVGDSFGSFSPGI